MNKNARRWFSSPPSPPPREETGKEDQKTTCLFSGGSLNTISRGGGHHLAGFLRCSRFGERWGRGLEVVLPLELPRLWVLDASGWGKASTRTGTVWVWDPRGYKSAFCDRDRISKVISVREKDWFWAHVLFDLKGFSIWPTYPLTLKSIEQ